MNSYEIKTAPENVQKIEPQPLQNKTEMKEAKNTTEKKQKGFSLFGSGKSKSKSEAKEEKRQPVINRNPRNENKSLQRPVDRPPAPPTSLPPTQPNKSGLADFFATQDSQQVVEPAIVPAEEQPFVPAPGTTLHNNMKTPSPNTTFDITTSLGPPQQTFDRSFSRASQVNATPVQQNVPSLNSSFAEEPSRRQTGRQSGRFRKRTSSSVDQHRLSTTQQHGVSPQQQQQQSAVMDMLIVDSLSRPTTPHNSSFIQNTTTPVNNGSSERVKKSSSISRTDSYRRARNSGGEDDHRGRVIRNYQQSLPRPNHQINNLRRGNSEDSLMNAMKNEASSPMPRSKSRQEKKGECSVM